MTIKPLARLSCSSFATASSPDRGSVAVTCLDGTVSLLERRADSGVDVRTLHKHDSLALAVVWRGEEVCSGGEDGRVICTDATTGAVKVIHRSNIPVQFVESSGDVLAYTIEDGSVFHHVRGEESPKLLYRHDAEPYPVAVSSSGDVASGADDGSVTLFNTRTGVVHRASSHAAAIYR